MPYVPPPPGRNGQCGRIQEQDRSIGRILYAGSPRRAIIPLRGPLLDRCSHLPACLDEPPFRPRGPAHAYLVLLRVEVAAFHPAMPPPVAGWRGTEMAVPVRARRARPADSSLWPYSSVAPAANCRATGRPLTVTPLCGVRTFLDGFASAAIARPVLPGHFSTPGAPPG